MVLDPKFREFVLQGIKLATNEMIDEETTPIKDGMEKFNIKVPSEWYSGHFVGSIEMIATQEFRKMFGREMNRDEADEFVNLVSNNTQKIREYFSKYDLI